MQTRKEIEKFQQKRLGQFEKIIRQKSAYFARQLQKCDNLSSVSLMDKSVMMAYFDEMNTAGIKKEDALKVALNAEETRNFEPKLNNITVGLSSGTSGNRGIFLVSDTERARWVAEVLFRLLQPFTLKKRRIAFFLRANSNLYNAIQSQLFDFHFFDLGFNLQANLNHLHMLQPDILVAPPSMLMIIAQNIEQQHIHISPKKVIAVAEVLENQDAEYLKKIFNQIIHQAYQCTEGFLASTCQYGTLHFHEDLVKIEKEYLDENRFYPVITDFTRLSQPIIRYRLNDLIHEKKQKCPCGSPFLAIDHIEGRSDDIFNFCDTEGNKVLIFPDFIRKAVITASETIEEFIVEQDSVESIKIYLKSRDFERDTQRVEANLKQLLDEKNIRDCKFVFLHDFPILKDTKLRRVRRSF